jgi:hypothetical protein
VVYRAHVYLYQIALHRYNRNMLFVACLNNAYLKLFHILAAAHYGNARVVYYLYYITAMTAN